MKTVVAETVLLGCEAFETLGSVDVIPDRKISPDHLADADALVIRSKTKVKPDWIAGSPVRFIGTATAGFDHVNWLVGRSSAEHRVGWCAAPGCNADSVADYITATLLRLHRFQGLELKNKTLGIIGVGQVGSRVAGRAAALGLRVLLNDPPRAAREGTGNFRPLENVLAESDIITLHVPLSTEPPWPTHHMAGDHFFGQMKPGSVFINAARGKVLDSDALIRAKESGRISFVALDVWDPEPKIRADVLATADIATPHIAGHSLEGKLNGTIQVYREACRFFKTAPVWDPAPLLPPVDIPELEIDPREKSENDILAKAVTTVYDLSTDQLTPEDIPHFDRLRASYRTRRELKNTRVRLTTPNPALSARLVQAGFSDM